MADVQFDFNPVDWTGFSVDTVVLDEGYALWFKNHPDGDGYCQVIGDGSSVVSALTPLFASGPKYLTAGRKFAEEYNGTPGLTKGLVKVAETANGTVENGICRLTIATADNGDCIVVECAFRPTSSPDAYTFEVISKATSVSFQNIGNIYLYYNSNVAAICFEALDAISGEITVQLSDNIGRQASGKGFQLVTPVNVTDPVTLPDGSTSSDYIGAIKRESDEAIAAVDFTALDLSLFESVFGTKWWLNAGGKTFQCRVSSTGSTNIPSGFSNTFFIRFTIWAGAQLLIEASDSGLMYGANLGAIDASTGILSSSVTWSQIF